MEEKYANVLHNVNLRVTKSRKEVLQALTEAGDQAISSSEIEQKLPEIDRITLYRILKAYEDNGLIHSISDGTGKTKYAICSPDCTGGSHHDDHIHFHCRVCETTTCLEQVIPGNIQLPSEYVVEELSFVVAGVCKDCNSN